MSDETAKGPGGYGRYGDDPEHVGCPRAKSDMTPCIARDGHLALAGEPFFGRRECVGCGAAPATLVRQLQDECAAACVVVVPEAGDESQRALDEADRWADTLRVVARLVTEPVRG